jgi:hypothetical protein
MSFGGTPLSSECSPKSWKGHYHRHARVKDWKGPGWCPWHCYLIRFVFVTLTISLSIWILFYPAQFRYLDSSVLYMVKLTVHQFGTKTSPRKTISTFYVQLVNTLWSLHGWMILSFPTICTAKMLHKSICSWLYGYYPIHPISHRQLSGDHSCPAIPVRVLSDFGSCGPCLFVFRI